MSHPKKIGKGAFSTVYTTDDNTKVQKLIVCDGSYLGFVPAQLRECNFLHSIISIYDHPYIPQISINSINQNTKYRKYGKDLVLLMERYQYDLYDYHINYLDANQIPTVSFMTTMVDDITRALHVMHTGNYIHRDIKPGNIMVKSDGRFVLIDFGSSNMSVVSKRGNDNCTYAFCAPEGRKDVYKDFKESDIYSLCATILSILFPNGYAYDRYTNWRSIAQKSQWPDFAMPWKPYLTKGVDADMSKRCTLNELRQAFGLGPLNILQNREVYKNFAINPNFHAIISTRITDWPVVYVDIIKYISKTCRKLYFDIVTFIHAIQCFNDLIWLCFDKNYDDDDILYHIAYVCLDVSQKMFEDVNMADWKTLLAWFPYDYRLSKIVEMQEQALTKLDFIVVRRPIVDPLLLSMNIAQLTEHCLKNPV